MMSQHAGANVVTDLIFGSFFLPSSPVSKSPMALRRGILTLFLAIRSQIPPDHPKPVAAPAEDGDVAR